MGFKDMLRSDIDKVFLNDSEFAVRVSIEYDGELIEDIPVILTDLNQNDSKATSNGHTAARKQTSEDNADGLYQVLRIMHASIESTGGVIMERGSRIEIHEPDGYIREYYITGAEDAMGMVRYVLGAFDE